MALTTFVYFLHIVITSIMFTETNTFYLPMIPIDSPKLQIMPQTLTTQEHHQFLRNISMARASSYLARDSNSSTNSIEGLVQSMLSNYYVTQLFFGGPNDLFSPYLILDTGDDKTWMQCDGCDPCFELKDGGIKAQQSPSYKLLGVDDRRCHPKLVYQSSCGYKSIYKLGMDASSKGPLATDTFYFINSQTKLPEHFPDLAFGCGMQNRNFFWGAHTGPNNLIAGVFGMAPGPRSFLNQLNETIQNRFSYCLTSWHEQYSGMSTIHYGAQKGGPNAKVISMDVSRQRYHLFFTGITVDGKRVPLDSSLCELDYGSLSIPKGFLIDSGAPYTVLPESIYHPLRVAMTSYFGGNYGWSPFLRSRPFNLCYDIVPTGEEKYPSTVFHFEKWGFEEREIVDWVMADENMFRTYTKGSAKGFCMLVDKVKDPGPCVFGAYQQANFRIVYDIKGSDSELSFEPERCQENRPLFDQLDAMRNSFDLEV